MGEFKCVGCQQRHTLIRVGQYFCTECKTDQPFTVAKENLQAGGFTTTPLTSDPSGITQDTSRTVVNLNKTIINVPIEGVS